MADRGLPVVPLGTLPPTKTVGSKHKKPRQTICLRAEGFQVFSITATVRQQWHTQHSTAPTHSLRHKAHPKKAFSFPPHTRHSSSSTTQEIQPPSPQLGKELPKKARNHVGTTVG